MYGSYLEKVKKKKKERSWAKREQVGQWLLYICCSWCDLGKPTTWWNM